MSEQKNYHPNLNIANLQNTNQKNQFSERKNDRKEFYNKEYE